MSTEQRSGTRSDPSAPAPARPTPVSVWLLSTVLMRAARGRWRLVAAVVAAVALGAVGLVVRLRADATGVPEEQVVTLVTVLVLTLYAPLMSLVQAAAVVGDLRDDGTLVYLWLRPVPRWRLAYRGHAGGVRALGPAGRAHRRGAGRRGRRCRAAGRGGRLRRGCRLPGLRRAVRLPGPGGAPCPGVGAGLRRAVGGRGRHVRRPAGQAGRQHLLPRRCSPRSPTPRRPPRAWAWRGHGRDRSCSRSWPRPRPPGGCAAARSPEPGAGPRPRGECRPRARHPGRFQVAAAGGDHSPVCRHHRRR